MRASPTPWLCSASAHGTQHVYAFVYEVAMDVDTDGRDLAALIGEMDFPALILAAVEHRRT